MKKLLALLICTWTGAALAAPLPARLTLAQCEADALASSPQLKQLQAQADAAQSSYKASRSVFYPTLTLDAQGSWVSEVPSLELGNMEHELGDNWGYSAGPTVNYVLFDAGARSGQSKSALSAAQSAQQEEAFARKQILLQVRQAYFTVQNDLERLYFLNEQLAVADKQLADVQASFDAGAKSRLDVYMARQQQSQARADIAAARGSLGAHLRALFRLTGTDYGINARYPLDGRLARASLDGETTAYLSADGLDQTLQGFAPYAASSFDENSPRLAALESMAQYYDYLADSYRASLYPRISLQGGAYFEYPNSMVKEHVFLGRAGAAVSLPLFEGGKNRRQADAERARARAAQYEKQDARLDLEKMFYSAKDALYALSLQEELTRQIIDDAAQTARLTYESYKAGAATFFDVDRANLTLLQSRLALAQLQTQQLNHLAVIDSLGKENL